MVLEHNQALTYSVPTVPEMSGKITVKGREKPEDSLISKSKEFFTYAPEDGFLMVDVDEGHSEAEVIKMLSDLYPPFGKASYLFATSASNGINDGKGYHLYFLVEDTSLIKQAMDNLFLLAFKGGYGFCIVNKGGGVEKRTFFDKAVYSPARLDFISGPVCIGFDAPERTIKVVPKENEMLAIEELLFPVDASTEIETEVLKVKPAMEKTQAQVAKERGIPLADYKAQLETMTLKPGYTLPDGTSVEDILIESRDSFVENVELKPRSICHPVEGGHLSKTTLFFNNGCPVIHSFKHGGQTWKLQHSADTVGDNQTLKAYHELLQQADFKRLSVHPETPKVLALMQGTYNENGWDLPLDTVEDMISLYLHMIIDDHRGNYVIGVLPGGGKTQTLLHIAWYIGLYHKNKSLSITFEQRKDIDEAYDFLSSKGIDVAFSYSKHSTERVPTEMEDLCKHQVIIHTHFSMRNNAYDDIFFTYRRKQRDMLIFDEAYFGTLSVESELSETIGKIAEAISTEEGNPKGLPLGWLKDLQKRLQKANILVGNKYKVPWREIVMPHLDVRFIRTAWRIKDMELASFLQKIFTIGNADEPYMRVSREGGKNAVLIYKANQAAYYDKIVNTDGTREVRKVHDLSPQLLVKYPVREKPRRKQSVYFVDGLLDSKSAMQDLDFRKLKWDVCTLWAQEISLSQMGVVQTNRLDWMPGKYQHIPYGRHKQTNEFSGCDGIIIMHMHRFPDHVYKNTCISEGRLGGNPDGSFVQSYKVGSMADETIQAMERGRCRKGLECPTLLFVKDPRVLDVIKGYYPEYDFIHYEPKCVREHNEKEAGRRKAPRADAVYASRQESDWGKKFRQALRKLQIHDTPDQKLQAEYLRDKRQGVNIGPMTWLKLSLNLSGKTDPKKRKQVQAKVDNKLTLSELLGSQAAHA